MNRSFRLLPLTMLVAFLVLGLKIGEVARNGRTLVLGFANEAQAQGALGKPTDALNPSATPATPAAAPADKKDEPKVNPPSTDASDTGDDEVVPKHDFSQVEIDLLQSLAKRRQELDDWAKQIQLKENMLIATEQRINDKIDSLGRMKKEIEALLAQYNEQEDTKIRSLVKIYENMKPKDAARIFEELDMPVLLTVVDRMNERKVSPILAAMNPTKAKDLTIQLAEQRKLQKPRAGGNTPPPATSGSTTDSSGGPAGGPGAGSGPAGGR